MVTTLLALNLALGIQDQSKEAVLQEMAAVSRQLAKANPEIVDRLKALSGAYASGGTKAFQSILHKDFKFVFQKREGTVTFDRSGFLADYYLPLTPPNRAKPPIRRFALFKVFVSQDKLATAIIVGQGGQNWFKEAGGESTLSVRKQTWRRKATKEPWLLVTDEYGDLEMKKRGFEDDWAFLFESGRQEYSFEYIEAKS